MGTPQINQPLLVSCIMPTRNRRPFVSQAIWYFLRQDYPYKELIVLDDGEDAVEDLIPSDDRIRYERLDRPMALGAKRNLACEKSRGELIAHWDDDDWMAPHRLSTQVRELLGSGADICGTRELLHYRLDAGEAWFYRYPPAARPWVAGCTLLYRRGAWARSPFPEITVGEDSAFVWQQPEDRINVQADSSFYVALIHAGNTSAKCLTDTRWARTSLDEVNQLIALDRDFYVRLRSVKSSPQTRRRSTVKETITVGAPVSTSSTRSFADLRDITFQPLALPEGVQQPPEDQDPRDRLTFAARDYCHEHSWQGTAERHSALWQSRETHH